MVVMTSVECFVGICSITPGIHLRRKIFLSPFFRIRKLRLRKAALRLEPKIFHFLGHLSPLQQNSLQETSPLENS
jgi:hypothetical protein